MKVSVEFIDKILNERGCKHYCHPQPAQDIAVEAQFDIFHFIEEIDRMKNPNSVSGFINFRLYSQYQLLSDWTDGCALYRVKYSKEYYNIKHVLYKVLMGIYSELCAASLMFPDLHDLALWMPTVAKSYNGNNTGRDFLAAWVGMPYNVEVKSTKLSSSVGKGNINPTNTSLVAVQEHIAYELYELIGIIHPDFTWATQPGMYGEIVRFRDLTPCHIR